MTPEELIKRIRSSRNLQLVEPKGSMSGLEFAELIDRYSKCISKVGLGAGKRVILPLRRSTDQVAVLLAALREGLLTFVVNPATNTEMLIELSKLVEPHAMFLDESVTNLLQMKLQHFYRVTTDNLQLLTASNVPLKLDPIENLADLALLTSGTTGKPKPILHKFESLLLNAELHAEAIRLSPSDSLAVTLPLHYSYGLVATLFAGLLVGCKLVFARSGLPISSAWYANNDISVVSTTPTGARRLLNSEVPPLRILTLGGDVTSVDLAHKILISNRQLTLFTTYGLTEAGPRIATYQVDQDSLENLEMLPLGKPLPGVSWRISSEISNFQEGELIVKTPTVMIGYYRQPKEVTEKVLIGSPPELRTGDFVRLKGQHIFFLGRDKRIISRGSEKIYPLEIEQKIRKFDGIVDVWVKSIPHNELGEVPKAFIVAQKSFELQDLIRHLRRHLLHTHIPETFELVQELPQEAAGK